MPIVKVGDLAKWAATLAPDTLIVLGDYDDYEDDDSDLRVATIETVVHQEYLYRWADSPEMGWTGLEPTLGEFPCNEFRCPGCEQGTHTWNGTPVWRLGP